MIPRTDFHCITPWVAHSSGWNSVMHLLILWFHVYGAIIQYKYPNKVYFDCKTILCLIVPGRQGKYIFTQEHVDPQGILNEQGHIFS